MRTSWGLFLTLVLAGCGTIEEVDTAALMRSTDLAGAVDAGSPDAGGTGGAVGTAGAPGTGGVTGAGGMLAGAGGAAGYTCADLLACCDSMPAGPLKSQCLAVYGSSMTGTTSCGIALAMIKAGGACP